MKFPPPPSVAGPGAPAPEGQKLPPPFPVLAPAKGGKTTPSIPHVSVKVEPPEAEKAAPVGDPVALAKKKKTVIIIAAAAAVVVLGAVGFVGYTMLLAPEPPPPPPAKAKAPAAAAPKSPAVTVVPAPAAAAPAGTGAPATPPPPAAAPAAGTSIGNLPAKAINKAKDVVEARKASGQSDVSPVLGNDPLADKPAAAPAGAPPPAARPAPTGQSTITKSVSATTPLEEAAAEASPEFRSFVANAKVSGVFQGAPARAFINGRMVRTGETVDVTLGIIFEGVDSAKRHLVFKDKSGAVVARRY